MNTQVQSATGACQCHIQPVKALGRLWCPKCGKRSVRGTQSHPGAFCGPESELVRQIKEILELNQVAVFRIGQWRADKSGSDEGVPDLMLCYLGRVLMMEVKVKGGKPSPTQRWLSDEGYSVIVWSLDEAIDACNKELGTEIKI